MPENTFASATTLGADEYNNSEIDRGETNDNC